MRKLIFAFAVTLCLLSTFVVGASAHATSNATHQKQETSRQPSKTTSTGTQVVKPDNDPVWCTDPRSAFVVIYSNGGIDCFARSVSYYIPNVVEICTGEDLVFLDDNNNYYHIDNSCQSFKPPITIRDVF